MVNTPTQQRYSWTPDVPDRRDYKYSARATKPTVIPQRVDLRLPTTKTGQMPNVYNQGQLGSCTANALAGSMGFIHNKYMFSRLFIYYGERLLEGTVNYDSGASLRTGIKFISKNGSCGETMWPYDINKFKVRAPAPCWKDAANRKISVYMRLNTIEDMINCLASGYPFVFGFSVYSSFESELVSRNGIASLPGPNDKLLGGHAVQAVGYDIAQCRFIVRNSWGPNWGQQGYFTLPFEYLADRDLSDDFWTIRV